ncbi:hypothetical protein [Desulfovibrio sp. JC010]|uniref:hypothetical protein n=1 Tax=Desulfovibrio sp. JC010 TaxID=2593641 RepID=UPI0013D6B03E|nr:hypothetical protein [Desulfovibrio sp. JC010]NDV28059.1 hypothetical protein [Desulfovibrio sp. JC010]
MNDKYMHQKSKKDGKEDKCRRSSLSSYEINDIAEAAVNTVDVVIYKAVCEKKEDASAVFTGPAYDVKQISEVPPLDYCKEPLSTQSEGDYVGALFLSGAYLTHEAVKLAQKQRKRIKDLALKFNKEKRKDKSKKKDNIAEFAISEVKRKDKSKRKGKAIEVESEIAKTKDKNQKTKVAEFEVNEVKRKDKSKKKGKPTEVEPEEVKSKGKAKKDKVAEFEALEAKRKDKSKKKEKKKSLL